MTMSKHPKTLLVIVAEAVLERRLVHDARERGAQGWTVTEVHGGGHEGVREGAWEADRTQLFQCHHGKYSDGWLTINDADTF